MPWIRRKNIAGERCRIAEEINELRRDQMTRTHYICPQCHTPSVSINVDDYFECRGCHTLYTTRNMGPGFNRESLIDIDGETLDSSVISVCVLTITGHGQFPGDDRIAELQAEIEALSKRRK